MAPLSMPPCQISLVTWVSSCPCSQSVLPSRYSVLQLSKCGRPATSVEPEVDSLPRLEGSDKDYWASKIFVIFHRRAPPPPCETVQTPASIEQPNVSGIDSWSARRPFTTPWWGAISSFAQASPRYDTAVTAAVSGTRVEHCAPAFLSPALVKIEPAYDAQVQEEEAVIMASLDHRQMRLQRVTADWKPRMQQE
ncbi:hypothetical protein Micbo1qcDRAFT_173916 [Microdochium bolleyi]|uniref:Uncharacterized protein n=1 Tax=Microdochium bolleyi TaxID=196109 RepID=A0A136J6E8_9PEZI|nr:hypothetical protein Micbo1qcDRAFT_173916 [Microdochium bolleyi]